MSAHSVLPPSSAARRIQCTGSVRAEQQFPQTEESDDSIDGTTAHWGGSEMLAGRAIDVGVIAPPTGRWLTQEMVEGADLYHADVVRELAPYGLRPEQGQIEQPVAIKRIHPLSWGTPDYSIWLPAAGAAAHLMVYDYKFGYRPVEVFENGQLIEYVAGLIQPLLDGGVTDDQILVTAKIVQPRAHHRDGPIRTWKFRAVDIRAHINIASNAAHEALSPNARLLVGDECRDCRARHACTALQRAALTACDVAERSAPLDMPLPAMALEYRTLVRHQSLLKARIGGLEEQLLAHGRRGTQLPGLRMEHGAGRERWTIPDDQVIAIGKALGVEVAKKPEAMTPKQAVAAGLHPGVLPGIVNTPRGEAKLVEDDGSLARRVFG